MCPARPKRASQLHGDAEVRGSVLPDPGKATTHPWHVLSPRHLPALRRHLHKARGAVGGVGNAGNRLHLQPCGSVCICERVRVCNAGASSWQKHFEQLSPHCRHTWHVIVPGTGVIPKAERGEGKGGCVDTDELRGHPCSGRDTPCFQRPNPLTSRACRRPPPPTPHPRLRWARGPGAGRTCDGPRNGRPQLSAEKK